MSTAAERWDKQACVNAGCHDLMDPVVVRQGAHILHSSVEVAVAICRRCGIYVTVGWTFEGERQP